MKYAYFYDTTYGRIGIAENDGAITNVFFGNTVVPREYEVKETPLLKRAAEQLEEYFNGMRKEFELPLAPEGTVFYKEVWAALCTIRYGETMSYGALASKLGRPNASRAVGTANRRNPISIFIPCHRVIGMSGKLTGYAGGLDMKEKLLRLEGALK